MRILFSLVLLLTWTGVFAQSVVFTENFDLPSGADSITAGSSGGTNPSLGDTSSQLYVSAGHSYHIEGTQTFTDVYFETQSFSTIGNPFVRLEFTHIAKLFSTNQATIQISTNNGASWTTLNASNARYLGEDPAFASLGYFNQISHQTSTSSRWNINAPFAQPDSSWFIKEIFDLTGIASDTSAGQGNFTGYANVKLRFNANFIFEIPPSQGFSAGWFVDDIKVSASTCELTPPQVSFDYAPIPCYIPNPQGPVPGISFNNYYIGAQVTENAQFDTGVDSVSCYFRVNGGSWMNQKLTLLVSGTGEYRTTLSGILDGDQVDYYLVAWDLSCPNTTRTPDTGYFSFTPALYPTKCNTSLCLSQDVVSSFPWTEDFEGPEWTAGSGSGDLANNSHRGDFPVVPDGPWTVIPPESGFYGWSIRTGPTGTLNTGPSADHTTGSGKYLYTEFSPNPSGQSNRGTLLLTPCIDLTDSTTRMLSFFYHSYGVDAGNIRIDVDTGSTTASWWLAYSRVKGPQQFSSSDPWKKAWVSLEPLSGKVIKLRFFVGVPNPNADKIDLAIDDLSITEPTGIDAQLTELETTLEDPCGISSSVPIKIRIRNLGPDTLPVIPVAYQLDNNVIVRDTLTGSPLGMADSTSFVFSSLLSFAPAIPHTFKVWLELSGDTNQFNDSISVNIGPKTGNVSQFPYYLDFESSLYIPGTPGNLNDPVWVMNQQAAGGQFEIHEGPFDNTAEGPLQGEGKNRRCLRINSLGTSAHYINLRSNCFDLSGMSAPSLSFLHYLASGKNIEIRVKEGNDDWSTLTSISGFAGFKDRMTLERVSLAAYAGKSIRLEFLVDDPAGSDWTDQFVLDNIIIADAAQVDLGLNQQIGSLRRVQDGVTNVPSFTINLDKSMWPASPGTQINLEFSSLCNASAPAITGSQSFTPVFGTPQTTQTIPIINLSDTLRKDVYQLKAWLNTPNDTLHFNDTIYQQVVAGNIVGVPYFNDFESCNYEFLANGKNRQWQLGTPALGAFSGNSAYVTNLDTSLISGSGTEKLIPPYIEGIDTLALVELRFYHRFNFTGNLSENYGTIQYLENGNWKPLVSLTNPPLGPGNSMVYDSQLGYVFQGNSGGNWQYFMTFLDEAKQPAVNVFRFLTESGPGNQNNWEIDDFHIYVPPQNSASPYQLIFDQGIPRASNQVSLRVQNTGARLLNNTVASIYDQNSNLLLVDTIQLGTPGNPMQRGSYRVASLSGQLPLQPGINELTIITSRPNRRNDAFPNDDTLKVNVEVLTVKDTLPYCVDFENSDELLSFTNGVRDYFWRLGTPAKTIMNGAYSGNNAWATDLQSDYPPLADNYLYTAPFDVKAYRCYELSFWHWFETEENFDGGNIEFTLDDGQTWQVLGSDQDSSWYNTPYVQALDAIYPGFSGSSGGWIKAFKRFSIFGDGRVQFRFRFASTATIHGEGWMIDDICFEQVSGNCQSIGQGDFPPVLSTMQLYPNPVGEELSIVLPETHRSSGHIEIKITNAMGATVLMARRDLANDQHYNIDVSALAPGSYTVEVTSDQTRSVEMFIKR